LYHPYRVYNIDVININTVSDEYYYLYFNYEVLYKLNVTLYTNLEVIEDEKFFFNTSEEHLRKLKELIENFIFYECDKINQDLFNRFVELRNKFPELDM